MRSHLETRGMLLSPLGDLSHTSILYYCDTITHEIFEYWRRVVSKSKKLFHVNKVYLPLLVPRLWHAAQGSLIPQ
jgi:hypothetical protein